MLADIPTIGVAKKLLHIDGLDKDVSCCLRLHSSLLVACDFIRLCSCTDVIHGLCGVPGG